MDNEEYIILRDVSRSGWGTSLTRDLGVTKWSNRQESESVSVDAFDLDYAMPDEYHLQTSAYVQIDEPPTPHLETAELSTQEKRDLANDPDIAALARIMPTHLIVPLASETLDSGSPWGVSAVHADISSRSGRDVVMAVLDTGIDANHDAFQGVALIEQDFTGVGNGDIVGHGTHCAGTIFGRDIEGKRIGTARGISRALIGKILDNNGRGSSDMAFKGLSWAVDNGANVVSMSLGFDFPGMVTQLSEQGWPVQVATSRALEAYRGNLRMFDALMSMIRAREAFGAGTLLVAASGNESQRRGSPSFEIAASLPAAAEGVLAVAAVESTGAGYSIAEFSNTFPSIAGPGVGIESARVGGGLVTKSGTSMACPHVAGVAALWWEELQAKHGGSTAKNVAARLLSSARDDVFVDGSSVVDFGVGLATAP
ncbi:subtilisin family serine protease [Arthrobacter sp. 1088]|uniref:S8 family peptidase n=1 Tax=Arthrobacter sp. 1088 TaxID=2817768 RepID=UPI00285C9027|nr:S8 family serine peptidase [Arthrobacter sp. 1088]MDR6687898.1 subtilisin family serine protease [Arthrobacter sp. 1088]